MLDELGITSLAGGRRGQAQRGSPYSICIAVANLKLGNGAVVRVCVGWKAIAHAHMFAARDEVAVLIISRYREVRQIRRAPVGLRDSEAAT